VRSRPAATGERVGHVGRRIKSSWPTRREPTTTPARVQRPDQKLSSGSWVGSHCFTRELTHRKVTRRLVGGNRLGCGQRLSGG
jgi:hypothetical protein